MTEPGASTYSIEGAGLADLVEAGTYASVSSGLEHSLVVLAMGEACWLVPAEQGHRLLVEPAAAPAVREQLQRFDQESRHWPPRSVLDPPRSATLPLTGPLVWAASVLAAFRGQASHPEWVTAGALDAQALWVGGEWWRVMTALWLHADVAHVVANVVSGLFLFGLVLATFGRARGAGLLLGAAALGNLAAAGLHAAETYRSIGASTAVFAALGLLTGRAVLTVARGGRPVRWRVLGLPLAAGLTLLALWGSGDVRVDVLAHATGFLAGLILGALPFISGRGAGGPAARA